MISNYFMIYVQGYDELVQAAIDAEAEGDKWGMVIETKDGPLRWTLEEFAALVEAKRKEAPVPYTLAKRTVATLAHFAKKGGGRINLYVNSAGMVKYRALTWFNCDVKDAPFPQPKFDEVWDGIEGKAYSLADEDEALAKEAT